MRAGAYEVLTKLGEGGAGTVFRGRGPSGELVAIKFLKRADKAALARFERERRLLAGIGSDGFVPLLDAGESEGTPYLVMPLVDGGTLRSRLEEGPLPVAETIEIGRRLAAALGAVHACGIVHRDVKPENVIFTREGRPLLSDLGIAKHFDRGAPGASQSIALSVEGHFLGTAGYMAPEQARDASSAGPPADVFALGAVLYECLAGEPAFLGETPLELMTYVVEGRFEPLTRKRPDAPPWLVATIERALAPRAEERPADGNAFGAGLERGRAAPGGRRSRALLVGAAVLAAVVAVVLAAIPRRPAPVPQPIHQDPPPVTVAPKPRASLEWNVAPDASWRARLMLSTLEAVGPRTATSARTYTIGWRVESVEPRRLTLRATIEELQFHARVDGLPRWDLPTLEPVDFDSTNPRPGSSRLAAVVGAEFAITLVTTSGEVLVVRGIEKIAAAVKARNKEPMRPLEMAQELIANEGMRVYLNRLFRLVPDEGAVPGWPWSLSVSSGPMLESIDPVPRMAKLDIVASFESTPPDANGEMTLRWKGSVDAGGRRCKLEGRAAHRSGRLVSSHESMADEFPPWEQSRSDTSDYSEDR